MKSCVPVVLALLCLVPSSLPAATKPIELKWTELASLVVNKTVAIDLGGGAVVEGEAVALRDDMLVIDVKKSSGTKLYPKGSAAIARTDINLVTVETSHGSWGRVLGTTVGVVVGLGAGADAAFHLPSPGPAVAALVGITSAAVLLGYYAGRQIDRHTTVIRIVP